ncbi:LysR family transcriptional regulator [Thalassobaculum sp. OXR-137]|uniref:LysR family transcriptional regulator n=1 Tax=Thalassobaculum sp. OXR-137 TaxID=3100173 RepID=UPI002AC9DDD4|nr:LysR family transcriptional regulator [Thalassobaculum sp. OXR-137]WPZ33890.1 LysR family transcriptional regulator [Thalassobaculum sp. OXR-137]
MISDWDNLRVFLALAEEGSLTAAARKLKVSHPTVARRVKALEDELGSRLFERLPDRFVPTLAATHLLDEVRAMEQSAQALARRSAGLTDTHLGTVRISVDETMAEFISRHLMRLRENHRCIEFEIAVAHISANLSRREADLLIRNRFPDSAHLVGRKLGRFAYAVYGVRDFAKACDGSPESLRALSWIGFDDDHLYMPGQQWQIELLQGRAPEVRTNNGVVFYHAIHEGHGVGVLPCFLGDKHPALTRLTPILDDVVVDEWMLVHRDMRSLPRIRVVMDALVKLFQDTRAEMEGRIAVPTPVNDLAAVGG